MSVTRVATYTRISTDEEHQPYSLDAQEQRLGAYIKSQDGWELARRFTDQMTGSTLERPQLQRALAEARAGRFDLLLVYRVDRLSRSVRGLAQILEDLDHASVHFRSATEPFDTGAPAGRMMVQMLGVFAEFERATLIDRVIAGMERKAASGKWVGAGIPFGYRANPDSGYLEADDAQAPLVPIIFDLYVNKRMGSRAIAAWLNDRGYRSRNGNPWSYTSVLTVLRNRSYLGQIFYRGIYHPAPHPALLDEATFNAAHNLLSARSEDPGSRRVEASDYLLGGLLTCSVCGKRYIGTAAHGKRSRYRYYTCYSRVRYGSRQCTAARLSAEAVDRALVACVIGTYSDTAFMADALSHARAQDAASHPRTRDELGAIQAEIRKTDEAVDRYFAAFEAGTMSEQVCSRRVEGLTLKLAELRNREAELLAQLEAPEHPDIALDELTEMADRVREALRRGTPKQQKAIIRNLVAEVRVEAPDALYPMLRLPQAGVRVLSRMVDPIVCGFTTK